MSVIYAITNQINGKQYVGKTTYDIEKRFQEHIYDSRRSVEVNSHRPLYLAMQKYGIENFSIKVLEEVDDDRLNERERFWILSLQTYSNGYNATLGGDGQSYIDKTKVFQLHQEGYNNSEIAKILGHERANISRVIKSLGLSSTFLPNHPLKITKDNITLSFDSREAAAQYLIENNITRSKKIKSVAQGLKDAIDSQKPYFGYTIDNA